MVCLDIDELKKENAQLVLACVMVTKVVLYPTVSNSKCCWCTQTCKFAFPGASYTRWETLRLPSLPVSQTSEAATVWAGTCNQHDQREWRQHSLLETEMMAGELDSDCGFDSGSKSGCLFSAGLGTTPWPSTLLAALAVFCAGLPSGCLRQGFGGGSGKQRLHPPDPEDAGKRPPRVKGVCGPSPARMPALLGELWWPKSLAWGKKKLKLISGLWMVLWLVGKGSSSCQGPVKKDPDMFILVRVHFCLAGWPSSQIKSAWK